MKELYSVIFQSMGNEWPYLLGIGILALLAAVFIILCFAVKMSGSEYRNVSGNGLFRTFFNTGNYGEFLTFRELEKLGEHRILTNLYLPLEDGKTTEADLLFVNRTGIYLLESKNYSGWIFGDEKNRTWTQTLKSGRKIKFYNPIWQNHGHLTAVDRLTESKYSKYIYSYIIFSERCQLKKIHTESDRATVLKRDDLTRVLKKHISSRKEVLTDSQTEEICRKLKAYILADEETKRKHIETVQAKRS